MPAPFPTIHDTSVGSACKYYAGGGGLIDLTVVANKPQACARRIVFVATGAVNHLKDSGGHDEPGSVIAGQVLDMNVSAIDSAVAFWAEW